jgi:hypothetical protein
MKRLRASALIAGFLSAGCGPHSGPVVDGGPVSAAPDGCATPCSNRCADTADCPPGLACTSGACIPTTPTSTNYQLCQLDADCPRGDHCALGVCTYDCLTDRDCQSGDVCDTRGRCDATADAESPPPVTAPTSISLTVSPTEVDFGISSNSSVISIQTDAGDGSVPFQALSSKPWLAVAPARGVFGATASQQLTLTVNRALATLPDGGVDTQASVRINSPVGTASVLAQIAGSLSGQWAGTVALNVGAESDGSGGYPLAQSSLQMDLVVSASGAITGYIEPQSSLLFPFASLVQGAISGQTVTLTFDVPTVPGSAQNPAGAIAVTRHITLTAQIAGSSTLTNGTYFETGQALETPTPYFVGGSFTLQRLGPPNPGTGMPLPIPSAAPASPLDGSAYDECRQEPATMGPLAQAKSDLQEAAPFYAAFSQSYSTWITSSAPVSGGDPWVTVTTGNCGGTCLDQLELRCAEYWLVQALGDASTQDEAIDGLLDAWQASADYALLFGNVDLVNAANVGLSGVAMLDSAALNDRSSPLSAPATAQAYFQSGSHSSDPNTPLTLLDPFFLTYALSPAFTSYSTMAPSPITAGSTGWLSNNSGSVTYTHLSSQLGAISGQLQAADVLSDWQFRIDDASDRAAAVSTISLAAMQGYLDAIWVGALMAQTGEAPTAFPQFATIASTFQNFNKRMLYLQSERNPSGYAPDYVFFQQASANSAVMGTGDNFDTMYAYLTSTNGPLAVATAAFGNAATAKTMLDQQSQTYTTAFTSLESTFLDQIADICGPGVTQTLDGCGQNGGTLYQAAGDAQNAYSRMQEAWNNIANLSQEIEIEEQRAQQVSGIYTAEAELITQNGSQIGALDQAKLNSDAAGGVTSGVGAAAAGALSGAAAGAALGAPVFGVGAAVGAAIGAVIGAIAGALSSAGANVSTIATDNETKAKDLLATLENAQVQYNESSITLVDSAATIQDKLLQQANLLVEQAIAAESVAQALAKEGDLLTQAQQLASQYQAAGVQLEASAQNLIQTRAYAALLAEQSQQSMTTLLSWTFLATRALEYQLNQSYSPPAGRPLWMYLTPTDLNTEYIAQLENFYKLMLPSTPQLQQDIVSVRDQLLDMSQSVTDAVTHHVYTPQERFQRYIADPNQRDANGNLAIHFMTYRPSFPTSPSQAGLVSPIFSSNVCNDMIDTLQANLIGDNLGSGLTYAYVELQRSGTGYLRSCSSPSVLTPYNVTGFGASSLTSSPGTPSVARLAAGVNSANNGTGCPANPNIFSCANTDLMWQPLLTGPWTLTIDTRPNVEPQNTNLNVDGLDDITLVFTHYGNTVQ